MGVVCAAATLALPAVAMADVEPNNGIAEAEGPVAGGVVNTGAVANSTDLDTYFFYVNGQQQIDVKVTDANGGECLDAGFGDADNDYLAEASYMREAQSRDFNYSTPSGVNRYYLTFDNHCPGEVKYSFTISPGAAVVGGASTLVPVPTGEPNENAEQAFGPLLGGVAYTGEIQTQNDEDWFKFYTAPGTHQFDIAMTQLSGCEVDVELESAGEDDDDGYLSANRWGHFTETSSTAGVYYLHFRGGCVGSRYEFVVTPPDALTTLAPPPPAPPALAPVATPPVKVKRGYAIANPSARVEKGNALLELTCAGAGDCAGTVSLVAHPNDDPTAKVVIGSGTFALARGTGTVLPVAVSRLGMGMLHLSPHGQVHVHLSGHDLKGGSLLLTAIQHHKRKRHRHHHRHHRHHRHH
jgi:hypothetical protein